MRAKYRTLYVPVKYKHLLEEFPNAGPNPNITGMKQHYWGMGAYCIKCGQYVYKVDRNTYYHYMEVI
jgi:hypothetical protein